MHLLVVEDDVKLATALTRGFRGEGYEVDMALTGDEGMDCARSGMYDAVILDLMLPGHDGFEVCRALHARDPAVPVLMLTARGQVSERIRGLDAGADDYLVKPVDFGELLARVRAHIRRRERERHPVLAVGDLVVDLTTREAVRDGRGVELTSRELAVLECLARNAGQPVARSVLLDAVWGEDHDGSPNVVDVYIGYLRKKLHRPGRPLLIRTVRGVGFVLERG
jgi:DNA-binding response OmpR family regulator